MRCAALRRVYMPDAASMPCCTSLLDIFSSASRYACAALTPPADISAAKMRACGDVCVCMHARARALACTALRCVQPHEPVTFFLISSRARITGSTTARRLARSHALRVHTCATRTRPPARMYVYICVCLRASVRACLLACICMRVCLQLRKSRRDAAWRYALSSV